MTEEKREIMTQSRQSLPGAKDAVESAPCTVIEVTRKVDAELIAATFTEHGATVEITEAE